MNPITSIPGKSLKGAHLRNTDYVTRSQHGGALLVTKKQIANQAVCPYCRAVTSKQTMTQHASVCKVQCFTDARPLYDSLGAPLKRGPKPVQGGAAMPKPSTPKPSNTTLTKDSEIRSILRSSEIETPLSQYASSAGIDQARNSTVRFTMEHFADLTGDATEPWQDIGPNVNSVFNGDGFGNIGAQAKLVSATMDVLPPSSFTNTDNAKNTVMVIGGTPMIGAAQEGDTTTSPTPRLVNSFAKTILASDKARWTRVAKVNYAKLILEGWKQESTVASNVCTAFRTSLCNPDTGAAFTNTTSLQARFTYVIEVEFPVCVKLKCVNVRKAKVTDTMSDAISGADVPAVMEPTSVRRGTL